LRGKPIVDVLPSLLEQAIEIQSQYTKQAYDTYMAEMSKLGEMYVGLARNAYKPVESVLPKKTI
jgi:hypothetical protein